MPRPNYYAIIPASVRYSDIPAAAKLMYAEITALSSKEGFCWATNQYFADLYGAHQNSITLWVKALEKGGFVKVEVDKMAGNKRKIWILADKLGSPLPQKIVVAPTKNSDSSINTINKKELAKPSSSLPLQEVSDQPTKPRPKRDMAAWGLRDKLYGLFEHELGVRPTPSIADYLRVVEALKSLTADDIERMVEDAIAEGKKKTVREMLTARAIDIYRQENL